MEEDNPLGLGYTPTFGDAIQGIVDYGGAVARFYQKGIPQFLTGVRRGIKEEAEAPSPITGTLNPIKGAGELTTAYSQAESAALEKVASGVEALGLPEPVAGAAALAVSPFIPGPAEIGLISKGGTAMMGLTVTDPRFIAKGVRQGIAETEEFAPGVQTLRGLAADVKAKQTGYLQQFEAGDLTDKQLTERFGKLKKRSDAKYSTLATPDDPDIFEVPSQRNLDPTNVDEFAHQHHVAPKSMTTPWVKKALEIGDDDDVVALFMLHKQLLGSGMGNVRTGMLDMPGPTHIAREARTELEKASNVHTMFKKGGADIEIPTKQVEKIIGDPKTMDELLDKYTTFMAERLVPMKELSIKRMNQFLAEHRSKLSSSEIEAFDKMVQKLNMAGQ